MSKIQNIKQAMQKASDNDATRAIKYLLWYIESQNAEIEFLDRVAKASITGSPEKNAALQLRAYRDDVDNGKLSTQEYAEIESRYRKNV